MIKKLEKVSDECSSGMMRVMHVAHSIWYLVCVLCVQDKADYQLEMEHPNTSEERRLELEYQEIPILKDTIKDLKPRLNKFVLEKKQIMENKGESII